MINRNELFRQFGPLEIEALFLLSLETINSLRVLAGLTPYTEDQAMTRFNNILSSLEPYDWD